MLINLSSIDCFLLTSNKAKFRWDDAQNLLNRLNIKHKMISSDLSIDVDFKAAAIVYKEALESSKDKPALIIFDDVKTTPSYSSTIDIPDDTDAFYLGTSLNGILQGKVLPRTSLCAYHDSNNLKILNMVCSHAILYISNEYKQFVINRLKNFIENPVGSLDELLATKLHYFKIYCGNYPSLYKCNGYDDISTGTPLAPIF